MSKTTSILNDLITTLKDGQEGFRTAAADVASPDLKTLFSEYSQQRSKFVAELQSVARSLDDNEPETTGSLSGTLHRGWIDLKSALSSKDEHSILAECERDEDSALSEYETALETVGLPDTVAETLRQQFCNIQSAHDKIRDLRDSLATK